MDRCPQIDTINRCSACGASGTYATVEGYDDDGNPIFQHYAHREEGEQCLRNQLASANKIIENDDDLAAKIANQCNDLEHSSLHCSTCMSRADGIEAYREVLLKEFDNANG